jgi:hypothetical protein
MQIWPVAVNKFEAVIDFTSKACILDQNVYRGRIIKSYSVEFGDRGNLSGQWVLELNTRDSTVHRQKKTGFTALNQTYEKH